MLQKYAHFYRKVVKFSKFSRNCDIGCDFKTTVHR